MLTGARQEARQRLHADACTRPCRTSRKERGAQEGTDSRGVRAYSRAGTQTETGSKGGGHLEDVGAIPKRCEGLGKALDWARHGTPNSCASACVWAAQDLTLRTLRAGSLVASAYAFITTTLSGACAPRPTNVMRTSVRPSEGRGRREMSESD
jgi:hypothetical protein